MIHTLNKGTESSAVVTNSFCQSACPFTHSLHSLHSAYSLNSLHSAYSLAHSTLLNHFTPFTPPLNQFTPLIPFCPLRLLTHSLAHSTPLTHSLNSLHSAYSLTLFFSQVINLLLIHSFNLVLIHSVTHS